MTVTRNAGADLLPFGPRQRRPEERDDIAPLPRPSHPRARLKAMRDAQARREREDAQRPYDADRLLHDLATIHRAAEDPRVLASRLADGDDERAELRRMGWTDERYDRVVNEAQEDLQDRVHPPTNPGVTAGAGVRGYVIAPAVATSPNRTGADLRGMAGNFAAARRMGLDPATLWPGQVGLPGKPSAAWLVGSAGLDRPFRVDQEPPDRRNPRLAGATTPPANRRARGRR